MTGYKNVKCCYIPSCTNTTLTAPDKLFVIVPRSELIEDVWFNPNAAYGPSHLYCCEDHFDYPSKKDKTHSVTYTLKKMKRNFNKREARPSDSKRNKGCDHKSVINEQPKSKVIHIDEKVLSEEQKVLTMRDDAIVWSVPNKNKIVSQVKAESNSTPPTDEEMPFTTIRNPNTSTVWSNMHFVPRHADPIERERETLSEYSSGNEDLPMDLSRDLSIQNSEFLTYDPYSGREDIPINDLHIRNSENSNEDSYPNEPIEKEYTTLEPVAYNSGLNSESSLWEANRNNNNSEYTEDDNYSTHNQMLPEPNRNEVYEEEKCSYRRLKTPSPKPGCSYWTDRPVDNLYNQKYEMKDLYNIYTDECNKWPD